MEEIARAEIQLGFELPSLLRRLYLEVGNGGFGPGYELYALNANNLSEDSLVTAYLGMRSMSQKDLGEHWADDVKPSLWPECVLMLCDWGCNIYSCLDCVSPELPVYRMDSNKNFMVEWAMEAPSLQQWLEAWMEGRRLSDLDWDRATRVPVARLGKV